MNIPYEVMCPDDVTLTQERFDLYQKLYSEKYNIVNGLKINSILEIGVRAGYSAYTFLQAFPDAKYIGLDPHNGTHGGKGGDNYVYEKWAKYILEGYNFELHRIDTQTETDLSRFGKFDFIHVDGDHTPEGVYHDLDLCFKILTEGGSILIDDYTYINDVKIGVDKWIRKNIDRVEWEFIDTVRGDIMIRAKK